VCPYLRAVTIFDVGRKIELNRPDIERTETDFGDTGEILEMTWVRRSGSQREMDSPHRLEVNETMDSTASGKPP
jgi:hypothetical protein